LTLSERVVVIPRLLGKAGLEPSEKVMGEEVFRLELPVEVKEDDVE
jgi:hypothetical protein